VVDSLGSSDVAGVEATRGLAMIRSPTLGYGCLEVNLGNANGVGNLAYATVNRPLAQSAKLRQALEEAIDRNALAKALGLSFQQGCTFIAPSSPDYDQTIKCALCDPADAMKLVAASGIPNPTAHLLVTNATGPLLAAQAIQTEEQAVGINVVIDDPGFPAVISETRAGNFDTVFDGHGLGVDPGLALLNLVDTQRSLNYTGFSSPQLDLIIANYLKSTSARSQKTLLHAAEEILVNARSTIILGHPIDFLGYTSLTGIQAVNGGFYRVAFAQYTG
jgi:peptide/nickel transport system substrate-binding protein